jgi:23S rRNA pseudouridine2605 synthase
MSDEQTPDANELEAGEATETADGSNEESANEITSDSTAETASANEDGTGEDQQDGEPEFDAKPKPPAKLERLQKILAQAGVSSRRRAEQLIEEGRVQVNGKVVTELGTKADAGRDHIRVDGKLLQGAERLRYFVLNKPKGFVTTVKDPEGRPTVMQFFEKMRERLYPVGRLDYMSEGLLLVTNDGELANKLTKAASGVEKTYLVKVSGQPTEAELEVLRGGVTIERGKPGSAQVRTSPARIRQVRQGDNPWYEVVLIEGRNRELRKMFEEIGHFVEKIRRVGYGPLVLDQEPGNLRELEPEELVDLRKAAEGKLRTPKAKDVRRRNAMDAQLPTLPPKPSRLRPAPPMGERPAAGGAGEYRPKRNFGADRPSRSIGAERPSRPAGQDFRPPAAPASERTGTAPGKFGPAKFGAEKIGAPRAAWKKEDRPGRPPARFGAAPGREGRPGSDRGRPDSRGPERPSGGRSFGAKPAWKKPGTTDRPAFKRPEAPRRETPPLDEVPVKRVRLQIDAIEPDRQESDRPSAHRSSYSRPGPGLPRSGRPDTGRPSSSRPPSAGRGPGGGSGFDRPKFGKPGFAKKAFDKPGFSKPGFDRPKFDRPSSDRPGSDRGSGPGRTSEGSFGHGRPPRAEGDRSRPFTTSTGKPRAGGARPSSKPGRPEGRTYGSGPRAGAGSRTGGRPAAGGSARPAGKTGWKPKPSFGGAGKPASGRSKPAFGSKPGGFSKSGYKGKAAGGAGARRSGPRPGGKRPGPGAKKRG